MKKKWAKNTVCLIMALATIIVFSGVAFAWEGGCITLDTSWNSTKCYNQFTTTYYCYFEAGDPPYAWHKACAIATSIIFTPGGYDEKLYEYPKSAGGYTMGPRVTVYATEYDYYDDSTYYGGAITSYVTTSELHLLIKNPYGPSGPKMESHGVFHGHHYYS